jgi:hypothetical protein
MPRNTFAGSSAALSNTASIRSGPQLQSIFLVLAFTQIIIQEPSETAPGRRRMVFNGRSHREILEDSLWGESWSSAAVSFAEVQEGTEEEALSSARPLDFASQRMPFTRERSKVRSLVRPP